MICFYYYLFNYNVICFYYYLFTYNVIYFYELTRRGVVSPPALGILRQRIVAGFETLQQDPTMVQRAVCDMVRCTPLCIERGDHDVGG